MPKQFDEETFITNELHVYNALEVAEAEKPLEEIIKVMRLPDEMPPIEVIESRVRELGYDTFEIHRIVTTESRYTVE